jgi:hypothetical protein
MRSSAEMIFAFNPVAGSTTVSTRLSHAASKSTGLAQSETLRSAEPQRLKAARLEPWTSP